MWTREEIPVDILEEIVNPLFLRPPSDSPPNIINHTNMKPLNFTFDDLIDIYQDNTQELGTNVLNWDIPEVNWLKNEIYNFVKESYPEIDENSKCISWFNVFGNGFIQKWHHHIMTEISGPDGERIFQNYVVNKIDAYPAGYVSFKDVPHSREEKIGDSQLLCKTDSGKSKSKNIPISGHCLFEVPKDTPTWTEFFDPELGRFKIDTLESGATMVFDSRILHKACNIDNMRKDERRKGIAFDIVPPNYDMISFPFNDVWEILYSLQKESTTLETVEKFKDKLLKLPNYTPRNDYILLKNLKKT